MDNNYIIQSVIINKNKYELVDAILYILKHGYKADKVDETLNYYRFRQVEPLKINKIGYDNYKTIEIDEGIKYIVAYK
jgi:hypothetical protein